MVEKIDSNNGEFDVYRDEIPGECSSKTEVEGMSGGAIRGNRSVSFLHFTVPAIVKVVEGNRPFPLEQSSAITAD